ncbi:chemotaxis protein [Salmonella enterica subsp. enterica serovar Kentucky]|nr:chemotaxis protein [Salmonella enterica subsp. enterica serovar Kentucky]
MKKRNFSAEFKRESAQLVTNGAIVIHTQRLKSDPGGNLLS